MSPFPKTPPSILVQRAVRPAPVGRGGKEPAGYDCPRCGSSHIVPALSDVPTEGVFPLRGGDVPSEAAREAFDVWLCSLCGYRWPHMQKASEAPPDVEAVDRTEAVPQRESDRSAAPALLDDVMGLPDVSDDPEMTDHGSLGFWTALHRAREDRGLTLSEAAQATGIWERDLELLEMDAPIEAFAARAYARFFLREYAEFLGLHAADVVREFDQRHPGYEESRVQPLTDRRWRWKAVAIALLTTGGIAFVGVEVGPFASSRSGEAASPALAVVPPVKQARSTRRPPPPPQTSHGSGLRAVLQLHGPCWVLAIGDGSVLQRSTLQPGNPIVFRAHHLLRLVLGNGGAVNLRVNGETVATGSPGQVVRLEFRWRHGRLFSRTG